jgi:predicted N-acyltransferase
VVAVGVVAGLAQQYMGGPGTPRAAGVGVVTGAAEAPEVIDGAVAGEAQGGGLLPDLAEAVVADVAADVIGGGERGAALDVAVGLDAEGGATGPAGGHVSSRQRAPEQGLVGAKVADVVAGPDADPSLVGAALEASEEGHQLEHLVGLEQQIGLVDGAAHGDGDLDLPRVDLALDQPLKDLGDLVKVVAEELGVGGYRDAGGLQVVEGLHGRVVAALDAADPVVSVAEPVDRDADALDPCLPGLAGPLGGEGPAAGGDATLHPVAAHRACDLGPVVAKVGLAADQRHLLDPQLGHLPDQVEGLLRRQLVGPRPPRPGAAVPAGEVAAQRDLPDRVHGLPFAVDGAHRARERQVPARRPRIRGDGKLAWTRRNLHHAGIVTVMDSERIEISTTDDIRSVAAHEWDGLLGPTDTPFVKHAWLRSLEEAGCVRPEAGWRPCHLLVRKNGALIAAAPAYLKGHTEGEFVFDHAWAQAAPRFGVDYYPKLIVAVPFTPATGRRLLAREDADRGLLVEAIRVASDKMELSGAHVLFPREEDGALLEEAGYDRRRGVQFQWFNQGYRSYEDFLGTFNAKRRHQLRRERREVEQSGVVTETYRGAEITDEVLEAMVRFYVKGVEAHFPWGRQYLNRRFFELVRERMGEHLDIVLARDGGRPIAGCFNVASKERLYGRYWGCDEPRPFLHFHVCYYHSIEQCIARGVQVFEPGAGGEHKLPRGFDPVLTSSLHHLRDRRFGAAIRDYLLRERAALEAEVAGLRSEGLEPRGGRCFRSKADPFGGEVLIEKEHPAAAGGLALAEDAAHDLDRGGDIKESEVDVVVTEPGAAADDAAEASLLEGLVEGVFQLALVLEAAVAEAGFVVELEVNEGLAEAREALGVERDIAVRALPEGRVHGLADEEIEPVLVVLAAPGVEPVEGPGGVVDGAVDGARRQGLPEGVSPCLDAGPEPVEGGPLEALGRVDPHGADPALEELAAEECVAGEHGCDVRVPVPGALAARDAEVDRDQVVLGGLDAVGPSVEGAAREALGVRGGLGQGFGGSTRREGPGEGARGLLEDPLDQRGEVALSLAGDGEQPAGVVEPRELPGEGRVDGLEARGEPARVGEFAAGEGLGQGPLVRGEVVPEGLDGRNNRATIGLFRWVREPPAHGSENLR